MAAFTFTEAEIVVEQLFPLVTAYEIVAAPAETPVTTPEVDTVATDVLLDDQVPPVVVDAN